MQMCMIHTFDLSDLHVQRLAFFARKHGNLTNINAKVEKLDKSKLQIVTEGLAFVEPMHMETVVRLVM